MHQGGLAPPPPGSGPPPPAPMYPSATQRQLEEAVRSDAGRGLEWVYVDVAGGGQLAALDALGGGGTLLPWTETTSGFGPALSAGAGVRLLYLTLGPRFRYAHFGDFDLWTLNLDVGWRIPLGRLEPYVVVGGGFAKLGSANRYGAPAAYTANDVSITGFDVRLGGGIDYYVSNTFSVGGSLNAELLRLVRSGAVLPAPDSMLPSYSQEGSGVGLVVTAAAVLGLHF